VTSSSNDDHVVIGKDGKVKALVGHDAVQLMRVSTLISGLKMHIATGGRMILTRGATPTFLLKQATGYTGKVYKRGQYQQAIDDLKVWMDVMKSALPVEVR